MARTRREIDRMRYSYSSNSGSSNSDSSDMIVIKKDIKVSQEKECCKICFMNKPNVLVPCGHECVCFKCYQHLNNKICPLCRKNIKNIIRVYRD